MISELKVHKDKMFESSELGFSTATDIADWLVRNLSLPFREAHHLTGKIVLFSEKKGCMLHELKLEDFRKIEPRVTKDIFNFISVKNSVNQKNSFGGTSFSQVKNSIKRAKKKIQK